MHTQRIVASRLAAMIATAALVDPALAARDSYIEIADCTVLAGLEKDIAATCGYLHAPENRADPHGRQIAVPFVRVHSRAAIAQPDALMMIPGGPGDRAFYSNYVQYQPALATRDVIWFEQRGTELSRPSLQCPEYDQATRQALLGKMNANALIATRVAAARTCAARARAEGVDLRGYSSREIAADIEDLRRLLGLRQINLYGTSYGGRIASLTARTYPSSIRSVVLNSPLPVEANYDEYGSTNMSRTLNMVFDGCATDPVCAGRFPDLRRQFREIVAAARRRPQQIVIEDQAAAEGHVTVRVTDWVLANALLGQLYSPYSFEVLPARIDAIGKGDTKTLQSIIGVGGSDQALLMRLAVWCNDEYPYEDPQKIQREADAFPEFASVDQSTVPIGACDAADLRQARPDAVDNAPAAIDVPVLIFAGEFDPATPPGWAGSMAKHMPNAHLAVFPGQGHGAGFNDCGWNLMMSFLTTPDGPIDASCLLSQRSPDFSRSARPAE